jgi:hypothetical protein
MYQSPEQLANSNPVGATLDLENPLVYADLDYDLDGSFDYDDSNLTDGQFMDSLPAQSSIDNGEVETHDKRKNSEDDGPDGEIGAKRREGEEKQPKKPGRKPLTSEPTSVSMLMTDDPDRLIHDTNSRLSSSRSEKLKTVQHNERSEIEKKSTFEISRSRSAIWRKRPSRPITKMVSCALKWSV